METGFLATTKKKQRLALVIDTELSSHTPMQTSSKWIIIKPLEHKYHYRDKHLEPDSLTYVALKVFVAQNVRAGW